MACYTQTGSNYGWEGVAFTSDGDVWARDYKTLRRLSFPELSDAATITTYDISSYEILPEQDSILCVDQDPLVFGPNYDGDYVLMNARTGTEQINWGPWSSNIIVIGGFYNPRDGKMYFLNHFGNPLGGVLNGARVFRCDPDGTNEENLWQSSTAAEMSGSAPLLAFDGAVWWATQETVYRLDPSGSVASLTVDDMWPLWHDPLDPSSVISTPQFPTPGFGPVFRHSGGAITMSQDPCEDEYPYGAISATSFDGTRGILVGASWIYHWTYDPPPPPRLNPGPASQRVYRRHGRH